MTKNIYTIFIILISTIFFNFKCHAQNSNDIKIFIGEDYKKSLGLNWNTPTGPGDSFNLKDSDKYDAYGEPNFKDVALTFKDKKEYTIHSCITIGDKKNGKVNQVNLSLNLPNKRTLTRDEALNMILQQAKIFHQETNTFFIRRIKHIQDEKNTERFISVPYDNTTTIQYNLNFDIDYHKGIFEEKDPKSKRWYVNLSVVYFEDGLPPK